ncbi:MAG: PAS domain S-box protein, partial [Kiritimatiellae bacterium]|nr:PAS domain S-box protein [Kiritimatiellia bacterium]
LAEEGRMLMIEVLARPIDYGGQRAILLHSRDVTRRRRIEEALREVAQGVSAATGFSFFYSLVEHLSRALGVDYVILGEILPGHEDEISTLAVHALGETADNFTYPLAGAPCAEMVKAGKVVLHANGVSRTYPAARWLGGWGVESYIGAPLVDSEGRSVGVLCVMRRQEIEEPQVAEFLLQIFAARAAAELERKRAAESLWESEERYRSLTDDVLDTSSIGTVILDSGGRIVWINQACERFFGFRRGELLARGRDELFLRIEKAVCDADAFRKEVRISREKGAAPPAIECHVLPDGGRQERWLEHWSQPIRSGLYLGGRIEQFADITERKWAEDQLRENEARLRRQNRVLVDLTRHRPLHEGDLERTFHEVTEAAAQTLEIERAGVWLFSADRAVLRCSDLYVRSANKHQAGEELMVAEFPAYFAELDRARTIEASDALTDPRTKEFAAKYFRPAGVSSTLDAALRMGGRVLGVLCLEHLGAPRRWTVEEQNFAGSMADLICLALEAHERMRAEAERNRLALAVEQAAEAILITDPGGTIQYANPAFEVITGYPRAEAAGQNPRLLKSGRHDAAFYKGMWETLNAGRVWSGRVTNRRKDGRLYEAECVISPIRDARGSVVGYVSVSRDVSREVELEEQFRQAQKMESVGRLAGGIAHDFNNLLTSILGFSRLIIEQVGEGHPIEGDVREIIRAGERAAKLTRQLLAFGRKQLMQVRDLDLNAVVMDMDQLLRRTLGEDIELVTLLGDPVGTIEADAGLLEQVIINLAVNARDAMPKGGKLTIETAMFAADEAFCLSRLGIAPGDYALLSVRDIGSGMTREVLDHAFEPFFTTKEKGKGTGLGLSTVYGIVKQLNGYVEMDSELNVGTEVRIYLPSVPRPAEKLPARREGAMPRGQETILVVEDEDTVRHLTVRMLKSLGYHVLEARHGGEALLICERYKDPIQLVLTDVVMPHVGGHEMMKRLHEIRHDFKVLYTSGFTEDRIIDHGIVGKDMPLLVKPYTSEAMAQKVREVLDGPPPA